MLNRKPVQPTAISLEKTRLLKLMAGTKIDSPEYGTYLDRLSKLDALDAPAPKPVSNDTKATIAANLAGLLIVVNHERANVIATKAMSMLIKPR